MTIYFATDHAGFALKEELRTFVENELGYTVVDCGAHEMNPEDDFTDYVSVVAKAVSEDPLNRKALILGGSGQGEAMCANRYPNVRAAVYYGEPKGSQVDSDGAAIDMITSVRLHNDSNVLSLGARFLTEGEARDVVQKWLSMAFVESERHIRRINKLG